MRGRIFFSVSTLLVLFFVITLPSCNMFRRNVPDVSMQRDTIYPLGFCTDSFDLVEGKLLNGETFSTLMQRLGMDKNDAYSLSLAADTLFDMKKMRAGNNYRAYYDVDSASLKSLKYLVYEEDKVNITVFGCESPFPVWKVTKPVEIIRRSADVTISSSLWNDMIASGVSPLLIAGLSDIYAWTVDFFSLQSGDRFRILYDEELCDGQVIDVNTILYAEFIRDSIVMPAIRLPLNDGEENYWNEEGKSLKKAFLKAPLKFTRISSGFSYHRRHPISGKVRTHTGVDYAAPTGTPVLATGNGTVIYKGWGGGGGNTVKIRHNSVYTTAYLHLSRYAKGLKIGQRVVQGTVIGFVGSTGAATGPHLDFRVWKNGKPINPLKMESPSAAPLPQQLKPTLDSLNAVYKAEIDSLK